LKLKFQTVAEKTAKNFRGLLYFAAPGTHLDLSDLHIQSSPMDHTHRDAARRVCGIILLAVVSLGFAARVEAQN